MGEDVEGGGTRAAHRFGVDGRDHDGLAVAPQAVSQDGGHHGVAVRDVLPALCASLVEGDDDHLQEEEGHVDVLGLNQGLTPRLRLVYAFRTCEIDLEWNMTHRCTRRPLALLLKTHEVDFKLTSAQCCYHCKHAPRLR